MFPKIDDFVYLVRGANATAGLQTPPPAPADALEELSTRFRREFGVPIPSEYLEFLAHMNGFVVGSLTMAGVGGNPTRFPSGSVYAGKAIPDAVEHARSIQIDYSPHFDEAIVLTYGTAMHGWHIGSQRWFHAFYETGITRFYKGFDELLADALADVNIDTRHLMPRDFEFSSLDAGGHPVNGTADT